ncbi:DUF445 domain-containing protein [Noviherbaspirillum massiliense]|uniref:DUF445 domain-containing protein n=1 Tax=Noviherbaspirillum massiliense TaxID=1465823 RepID=UPI0003174FD8|nr:DUF445 domain-containing protein [Noviherbaspirillum massiliense]
MRRLATGLLVLMAVVFVAARLLQPKWSYLSFVSAFAEAAMVGALADWFAVTALFRAPLGLPIPHTAIIPRNKERIGESLANFLENNFITQEIIRDELRTIDFAGAAAQWLARSENSAAVARQIMKGVPALLRVVEDEDIQHFIQGRISSALEGVKFAPICAEVLTIMAARNHHQELFSQLIEMAAGTLDHNKSYIRWRIHEASPRWLPKTIDDKLYQRLLDALESTLAEMRDEDSEWRLRFEHATNAFIEKLRTSPEYEAKIDSLVREVLAHPMFRDYVMHVWLEIKERLVADAASKDSRMRARLEQAFRNVGADLLRDAKVQSKINQGIRLLATEVIVERRKMIADLVARVIRKWDAETVSRKLELHVGKDLQYIRINGTLVGGLVGLGLHVISLAL